ncbi:hypothetical protein DENSPDRAFT_845407 [Dentipellis sp. KUC8613]|nr:hypothetical protein DENSPDRAFT_845407 [Dentipellis sp. KUC8613]
MTSTQQPLILYDIPSSAPGNAWSPNPWKARLALHAKGIPYRTVWVEYPHIAALCQRIGAAHTQVRRSGPYYTLPVLEDPNTGAVVSDSLKIAQYLDATYTGADAVRLVPDGTAAFQAMFVDALGEKVMFPLLKALIAEIVALLNAPSAEYFRRTREAAFGVRIEEIAPRGPVRDEVWKEVLGGLSLVGKWEAEGDFVMGGTPCFADLALVGLLQWVKVVEGVESKEWKDLLGADGGRWARLYEALEKWIRVDEGSYDREGGSL